VRREAARAERLNKSVDDKGGWQAVLDELNKALDEPTEARVGIVLEWRLRVVAEGGEALEVSVRPFVKRLGKRGVPGVAKPIGRRHLFIEFGSRLAPEDARVAELLPEDGVAASRPLLEALVDHPRVFLEPAADDSGDEAVRAVQVDRTTVGLVAEARGSSIRVTAAVDGTALPPSLRHRVATQRVREVVCLWDGGRLTLLDVRPELKIALASLARSEGIFPQESVPTLLETLARFATRLPVAMPRSVLGESVSPTYANVVRLAVQPDFESSVELEIRLRPLPEAPSVDPGVGLRDVHVRRDGRAFHAVRDLRVEKQLAAAFLGRLPLAEVAAEPIEDEPWRFVLPNPDAALRLLAVVAGWETPPVLEWVGIPLRPLGAAGPRALKVALVRRHEWFGVLGELSVAGERIGLARLLDAARRKETFVHVAGGSFLEMSSALRDHLTLLADHLRTFRGHLEIGPSSAAHLHALETAGVSLEVDDRLRTTIERVAASGSLPADHPSLPPVPSELQATLRSYQRAGYHWLLSLSAWGAGGVLADDMGLGKTVQTLALLLERARTTPPNLAGPTLVVAPASVTYNWRDEIERFAPSLRVVLYGGTSPDGRAEQLTDLGPRDVVLVTYGLLVRDRAHLANVQFATAIFDEAQQLKNAGTQRFRAATAINADLRLALSGTPMENHLGELWSLFAVVFPALLGPWSSFRERFALPIEKENDRDAADSLARVLAPFLLRRTKLAVAADLPPRTEIQVPVAMSEDEWSRYEDARLAALSDLGKKKTKQKNGERRIQVLAALTRLRLLACHPRLQDPTSAVASSKLARLLELLDELSAEGQRALVFSQFTSHLALVREALDRRQIPYLYLDGQTPIPVRSELVAAFQGGSVPFFLLSLKASGFGINLTEASNVIHLDPWWNPAVEDQASDRTHRLGQTKPVTIYRFVSVGTIEEQMMGLHAQKRSLIDAVFAAGPPETDEPHEERFAGRLDTSASVDELFALLDRRRPAD
jgi:hypothetical protein